MIEIKNYRLKIKNEGSIGSFDKPVDLLQPSSKVYFLNHKFN
jgi:hypothetical protein